ncbi:DUF1127 domain-containing protein [Vineibacter terrae]|nr:DUF1127 domain-containing protein [Vineibacter terrae]
MSYIRSPHHAGDHLFQSIAQAPAAPSMPAPDAAAEAGTPASALQRIAAVLRTWQARRRERLELAQVDERTLRELGLSPTLVDYELRRPFWRPTRDWRSGR